MEKNVWMTSNAAGAVQNKKKGRNDTNTTIFINKGGWRRDGIKWRRGSYKRVTSFNVKLQQNRKVNPCGVCFYFYFFQNSQREFIKSFNRGRMFDKESISMSDDIFVNWHWGVRCDVSVERANPHARPPAVLRAPCIQHGKWFVIDAVDTIFERVRALRRSCIRIHYE